MKTNWRCLVIGLGFALACAPLLRGQTEGLATDQVNDYYHYNNNTLQPWQSFTAGEDGFLAAVQVHIFATSADSWSAVLEIHEGEGTAGHLLTSQTVTGDGVSQQRTFVLETPVRQHSGSVYTFIFRENHHP